MMEMVALVCSGVLIGIDRDVHVGGYYVDAPLQPRARKNVQRPDPFVSS